MINLFQLCGDLLHLLSFAIIVYKIHSSKSCNGISAKTQEIYLIVFCSRYLDLFMYFISLYNTVMKITFIAITIYILYLMHFKSPYKNSYNRKVEDGFPHYYLIPFAMVMTLFIHRGWRPWDLIWSFSLWMESVAVFPQIYIIQKNNGIENFTAHYLASLGIYRFFYLLLWIYRYAKYGTYSWVSILSGTVQVLLYADFLYLYLKNIKNKLTSALPVVNVEKKEEKSLF